MTFRSILLILPGNNFESSYGGKGEFTKLSYYLQLEKNGPGSTISNFSLSNFLLVVLVKKFDGVVKPVSIFGS